MITEKQIAEKIIKELESGTESLPAETLRRLKDARLKAVAAMPLTAAEAQPVLSGWGRLVESSHHAGPRFWLPAVILLTLLMAVLAANMSAKNSQPIDADALLLASDLPPEAFSDKEFVAWLENSSHP